MNSEQSTLNIEQSTLYSNDTKISQIVLKNCWASIFIVLPQQMKTMIYKKIRETVGIIISQAPVQIWLDLEFKLKFKVQVQVKPPKKINVASDPP